MVNAFSAVNGTKFSLVLDKIGTILKIGLEGLIMQHNTQYGHTQG